MGSCLDKKEMDVIKDTDTVIITDIFSPNERKNTEYPFVRFNKKHYFKPIPENDQTILRRKLLCPKTLR
jgi:hypothetical protein